MRINKQYKSLTAVLLVSLLFFSGCSQKMTVTCNADSTTTIALSSISGENLSNLVSALTGTTQTIFSSTELKQAIAKNGGKNINVHTSGIADLDVSFSYQNIKEMSQHFSKLFSQKQNKLILTISTPSLLQLVTTLPQGAEEYLELLMAPIFTGEKMTEDEYIELIAGTYGKTLAQELKSSYFEVIVIAKDKTRQIKSIPLSMLLTLSDTMTYTFDL